MGVTYLDVLDQQDVGQRADNFLMRILKGVPRQHIYRILRRGEVRVNGGRVKASYRLQLNDRIRIPPVRTREEMPVKYSDDIRQQLLESVLYEDDDFLIINKPSGVAVHGGSSISAGVIEILRDATGNPRLELVHRLDRGTSGCLAMAKKRSALRLAQEQFRERTVKKIYEVLVAGVWPKATRVVQLKLQRYETSWGERRVRVDSHGQSARTDFAIVEVAGDQASRLQATLHTGRTHQIRVHTSASGHGVLGDDKYSALPAGTVQPEYPRLCLHAKKLHIPMPTDVLKVTAPVSEDIEQVWQALKLAAAD